MSEEIKPPQHFRMKDMVAVNSWKPISLAPKDGTRVLLACKLPDLFWKKDNPPEVRLGYWDSEFDFNGDSNRGAWTDGTVISFGCEELRELFPTHFQPLPDPPEGR